MIKDFDKKNINYKNGNSLELPFSFFTDYTDILKLIIKCDLLDNRV